LKRQKETKKNGELLWKEVKDTTSRNGIPLPTLGTTRNYTTKTTMELPTPSWDSQEQALPTYPYNAHDDNVISVNIPTG